MRVGVLGTGIVGRTLSVKLIELGHDVIMGTRDVDALLTRQEAPAWGESFADWRARNPDVPLGTFAEAAAHGEIVLHATNGGGALDALNAAGKDNLDGKILIDVANPLDFSQGFPPSLSVTNTDSLGEQIQRAFPGARVVKTLNTVSCDVMIAPQLVGGGDHHAFVSGNDAKAKEEVTSILRDWFGWKNVLDLGDITTARGTEMLLALWVRLMGVQGNGMFNVKVVT
jgi:predicted dinucleotide-binding enzyme